MKSTGPGAQPAAAARRHTSPVLHALGSILGATAFRQALVHMLAVLATGAAVMWLLYGHVNALMSRQIVDAIAVEADAIAEIARSAGTSAAVAAVRRRAEAGSAGLYFLELPDGSKAAGNLDRWPASVSRTGPGGTFRYTSSSRPGAPLSLGAGVVKSVAGGMRLLVGRDLEQHRELADRVKWLFLLGFGALAIAGIVSGALSGRLALRRVAEMTRTTDAVMAGDLTGRLRVTGSGDELDHLARNLNAMLDRIEQLMAGLREVSDNIAHDLKTPLSRLRSRAEAALRGTGEQASRDALGRVIEDADELIKTFNALLLIARLEAGAVADSSERFDLAALVADVTELYSPVAEQAGVDLHCDEHPPLQIRANRQLVGQAIANMVDNAIKYGRPSASGPSRVHVAVGPTSAPGEIAITVADNGPGIPASDRERALKRFVRLEESRTRPGTGLGLSLVAAVARLHGGRILLQDNDPGLRIVLVLPSSG